MSSQSPWNSFCIFSKISILKVHRFTSILLKFDFSMKVTFKGITANVTAKFTLARKCHILADFQKKCKFLAKLDLQKIPYRFLQGVFCFKCLAFITFQAISKMQMQRSIYEFFEYIYIYSHDHLKRWV